MRLASSSSKVTTGVTSVARRRRAGGGSIFDVQVGHIRNVQGHRKYSIEATFFEAATEKIAEIHTNNTNEFLKQQ